MRIYQDDRFKRFYDTERLRISILDAYRVRDVLAFLNAGSKVFDQYESEKSPDYYTTVTQRKLLDVEYKMAQQKSGVRFWISLKDDPSTLIGTVSFSFLKVAPFSSVMVGYKFLPEYWHQGYAQESIAECIQIVRPVLNVSRVEAYVLPDNKASQTLLSRLGFRLEGTAYSVLEVCGTRRDHLQYSYVYQNMDLS